MVCEICNDTGWYGPNGPGILANDVYFQCEYKKMKIGRPKCVTLGKANNICPTCGKVDSPDCPNLWHLPGNIERRKRIMNKSHEGYTRGVVYILAQLIRNGNIYDPEWLWNESGFKEDDLRVCDEYDSKEIKRVIFPH